MPIKYLQSFTYATLNSTYYQFTFQLQRIGRNKEDVLLKTAAFMDDCSNTKPPPTTSAILWFDQGRPNERLWATVVLPVVLSVLLLFSLFVTALLIYRKTRKNISKILYNQLVVGVENGNKIEDEEEGTL